MNKDQIYTCSLTVRLVKKNYNSQKTLGIQLIHVPVTGRQGAKYHVDYQIGLPQHFHLARRSLSVIAGRIEVGDNHAFLSNDNESFIYEADAGYLMVRYVNQNHQEVGHKLITADLGQRITDVAKWAPVPRGYQCHKIPVCQIKAGVQFRKVAVRGLPVSPKQSGFKIIQRKVDRNGKLLNHFIHTIHLTGRIGDSFSLRPDDYRLPGTVAALKLADVNGRLTPDGPRPQQANFTYVQSAPQLHSYPLTVKVLQKDQDRVKSRTIVKPVRGRIHQRYIYSFRDFQPRNYRLDSDSLTSVSGYITKRGLTKPSVIFIYDRIKMTSVKYVNQHHQQVGSSRIKGLRSHKFQSIMRQLKLPPGYSVSTDRQEFEQQSSDVIVQVQGKSASHDQNAVRLLIIERYQDGRVSKRPRVIHISGCIGDRFKIDPQKHCPQGFSSDRNRPIRGMITYSGTRLDHHVFVYVQEKQSASDQDSQPSKAKQRGRIMVYYLNHKNQMVKRKSFSGSVGEALPQSDLLKDIPKGYRFVKIISGHQSAHFQIQDQIITIEIKAVASSSQQSGSVSSPQAKSAVQQHSAANERVTGASSVASDSSSSADRQASSSSSAASKSSAPRQHGQQKSQRSKDPRFNLVKDTFLNCCYSQIFGANLVKKSKDRHHQQAIQLGVAIAHSFMQGVTDALHQRSQDKSTSHSYQYGYQSCQRFIKKSANLKLATALLIILNHLNYVR